MSPAPSSAVRWLPSGSEGDVRAALRLVAPALADEPLTLAPRIEGARQLYWRGTARLGADWVVKFAWSAPAAAGVERELRVLAILPEVVPGLPAPRIVHASLDPLLFVTRYVDGAALGLVDEPRGRQSRVPEQLADALVLLHQPRVRDRLEQEDIRLGGTEPQATTDELRQRLAGVIVTGARAAAVERLCDWADGALAGEVEPRLVHGDVHGHNAVVSFGGDELRLLADFENAGLGDPHYDLRYLPSTRPGVTWFKRVVDRYERTSGTVLSLDRILAWHVRTALGDALWRTELGVPLPHDLTPDEYVDDILWRMDELDLWPG